VGVNLAQAGDTAAAVDSFRKPLSLDPRTVIATYNPALAYARLGKMNQAIAGFPRILELDPTQLQSRIDLARAHEMQGNTDSGIKCFKRVIAEDPGFRGSALLPRESVRPQRHERRRAGGDIGGTTPGHQEPAR